MNQLFIQSLLTNRFIDSSLSAHITRLLRNLYGNTIQDMVADMPSTPETRPFLDAYRQADEKYHFPAGSQQVFALCLAALPAVVPEYPIWNVEPLLAHNRLDLLHQYHDNERGKIVHIWPVYNGKYMVIETAGYRFARNPERHVFWPGLSDSAAGFYTFEDAFATALSEKFGDAIRALIHVTNSSR